MFRYTKAILIGLLCSLLGMPLSATTYYFSPSSAGSNNGVNCANAYAWTDATNGLVQASGNASWGSGNTAFLCQGTYSCSGVGASGIWASGRSFTSYTIKADTAGAVKFDCGYWGADAFSGGSGAIVCYQMPSLTIDGSNTLVIENTANGTGLANQHASSLVWLNECDSATVKNMTIGPAYVKTLVTDTSSGSNLTTSLYFIGGNNWTITGNTIHDAYHTLAAGWDVNNHTTSGIVQGNNIYNACHTMDLGDYTSGLAASGITIDRNTFGPGFLVWGDLGGSNCHNDGVLMGGNQTGSSISNATYSNNTVLWDGCENFPTYGNCTAPFGVGTSSGITYFNNVIYYYPNANSDGAWFISPLGAGTNIALYNNTVILNYNSGSTNYCATFTQGGGASITGFTAKNNICENGYWGWFDESNIGFSSYFASSAAVDHNDYYGLTYIGTSMSVDYTFASWQTAGYDTNGSNGDPKLNSSYIPQVGSAAIGLGANLTSLGITALDLDQAGNARPASGAWTAGALNAATSVPQIPSTKSFVWNGSLNFPVSLALTGDLTMPATPVTMTIPKVSCACTLPSSGTLTCTCN